MLQASLSRLHRQILQRHCHPAKTSYGLYLVDALNIEQAPCPVWPAWRLQQAAAAKPQDSRSWPLHAAGLCHPARPAQLLDISAHASKLIVGASKHSISWQEQGRTLVWVVAVSCTLGDNRGDQTQLHNPSMRSSLLMAGLVICLHICVNVIPRYRDASEGMKSCCIVTELLQQSSPC